MNSAIFVAAVIWSFLCHFVEARPDSQGPSSSSSDLDTSFFDTDSDYDYEPYFVPTSNFKSEVKDPWTYDFRNKLAENKDIDTFAGKITPPQAEARMFIDEGEEETENESDDQVPSATSSVLEEPLLLGSAERLIDNKIPTHVTEVPLIEVPTKFEDLLQDPQIVFKSVSGSENRVNAKVIRRLKEKKSSMDRARELLRTRLNPSTTTTQEPEDEEPFITVVEDSNRGNRPKPFSKLTNQQPTTTFSTLVAASTTTPITTTLSIRDKMVSARNRLRKLMGEDPIGITTTKRPSPTTPTASPPTKMDMARQRVVEMLEKEREEEEIEKNLPGPEFVDSGPSIHLDPLITVTAKSTIGDVDPGALQVPEVNPLVLISPTFPPETETSRTEATSTESTTASLVEPSESMDDALTTPATINGNQGDVPTRMQDTLQRLMKQKGLRRDPFERLVTTAVTLIDDAEEFEDFTAPSPRQNPFLTKTLRPEFDDSSDLEFDTPRPHQDVLLGQLQANHDGNFEGLSAPSLKQNPFLGQLRHQKDSSIEGLNVPSHRQNPLLRNLRPGDSGDVDGIQPPSHRQNPLLRQLKNNGLDRGKEGLSAPSKKQNPLLKNLHPGDKGEVDGINPPKNPLNDPLFRASKPFSNFNPDHLNLPNKRQNPLLRILRFDRREKILNQGLTPPRYKQNPLFRQLVSTPQKYKDDFLQLPPRQQDKLLSILRKHGGDNFDASALLSAPRFTENSGTDQRLPSLETLFHESIEGGEEPESFRSNEENEYYDDEDVEDDEEFNNNALEEVDEDMKQFRPVMPKSKFEILQIKKPVEEVTFQRVNSPLSVEDKKEDASTHSPASEGLSTVPIFFSSEHPFISPDFLPEIKPDMSSSTSPFSELAEFTVVPETTTTAETVMIMHEDEEVVGVHEFDSTTSNFSGIPLESLELTTEFGKLNFEDFEVDIDSIEAAPAAEEGEFEREMMKVIQIMKVAGDDLPVTTIKTLVTDLVKKAKVDSQSKEEQKKNFQKVGNLVNLFKEANAQRAKEAMEERRPTANPVQEEIQEAVTKLLESPDAHDERDFSKVLFEKAKKRPVHVPSFEGILEVPTRDKPRLHIPNDFSHILLNKAKQKPDNVKNFDSHLDPPVFVEKPKQQANKEDFSQILINKAKARPTHLKDFDSDLSLPINKDYDLDDFSTLEATESMNLTEILKLPQTKEMVEDHIMDMIIENPEKAAADLAELFDINSDEEKVRTEEELHQMIEQDPLAVTSAFTDLIISQKENLTPSPPPLFEPHHIEDPPKAVQGQMLRMTMRPNDQTEGTMQSQVLQTMMRLIEEGRLSHEEVIEQMINNGLLPVEVTEVGKIPIIVGGTKGKAIKDQSSAPTMPPFRSQPLRIQPTNNEVKEREEVNLDRLQQLRARQHQMVAKDEHDILKVVSIDDPDGDFEMVKLPERQSKEISVATAKTPEEKDIEILSSMMDLYEQGLITDKELEQMVVMMEEEGVLDIDLNELGIVKGNDNAQKHRDRGEGPSVGSSFGYKHGAVPFTMAIAQRAKEELSQPFKGGLPRDIPESPSPTVGGYSYFSMATPRPMFSATTPRPVELPPPNQGSVHNAAFFEELGMRNPFESPFDTDYTKTSMSFQPRPASNSEDSVKPGPAPPYYMSSRLPPPQEFMPKPIKDMDSNMGGDFDEFLITKESERHTEPYRRKPEPPPVSASFQALKPEPFRMSPPPSFGVATDLPFDHPEYNLESEMFHQPFRSIPREPFPPPSELKRHVGSQPLPLILHAHEGAQFSHPHFDIPSELINPDAFYRSPRKIAFDPHENFQQHHYSDFAHQRGEVVHPRNTNPSMYSHENAGLTGYREVDRRIDQIRQSFLKGDGLGSSQS